jgi:hypothetical protein
MISSPVTCAQDQHHIGHANAWSVLLLLMLRINITLGTTMHAQFSCYLCSGSTSHWAHQWMFSSPVTCAQDQHHIGNTNACSVLLLLVLRINVTLGTPMHDHFSCYLCSGSTSHWTHQCMLSSPVTCAQDQHHIGHANAWSVLLLLMLRINITLGTPMHAQFSCYLCSG